MRLLLLLVFVVSTSAFFNDILEKLKGKRAERRERWGKLSVEQREKFKQSLNRTDVERFHGVLEKLRERTKQRWNSLSEEDRIDLSMRMKGLRNKTRSNKLREKGDTLVEVNEAAGLGENLYQGDMVLTNDQIDIVLEPIANDDNATLRERRQAYKDRRYPNTIWGTTVYYYFDASLSAAGQRVSNLAIAYWQANTCINFVQSSTAANRIRFFKGQGCYSYVGRIGGQQDLSLGAGCESFGTAAHEIGHALGFFHEQSRNDRDTAITVNVNNVQPGFVDQFDKETTATNFNYEMPYDYGSVMHYGATSASSNGQPTMVAKSAVYQDTMGSDIVSFYDLSMMNEHYSCKAKCVSGATCLNGGFRNSRNCNACICPRGWGGATCNTRPSGCGASYTATTSPQTISTTVGDDTAVIRDTMVECNWQITAPAGKKIEITLTSLARMQCFEGCVYGGVEVKATNDHRNTGMRYCCNDDIGAKIVSQSNIVPIIAYNGYNKNTYVITYRYVDSSVPSTVTSPLSTITPSTGGGGGSTTNGTTTSCVDANANCGSWVSNGFCTSPYYTSAQKKSYCAGSCKLC